MVIAGLSGCSVLESREISVDSRRQSSHVVRTMNHRAAQNMQMFVRPLPWMPTVGALVVLGHKSSRIPAGSRADRLK